MKATIPAPAPTAEVSYYDVTSGLRSAYSKEHYKWAFKTFLTHIQIEDPSTLLQKDPRFLESIIIEYIIYMAEDKHLSHNSIRGAMNPILHFFEMNDIVLNKRKISKFVPADENSKEDKAYTHEEIQKLLAASDERFKCVILLMASTGMRVGAIPDLQIGDLTKIPEYNIYKIIVYARSKRDRCYCFSTAECAVAIDSYLAYRERCDESLKPEAPLIREQFDMYDRFAAAHPRKITLDSIKKTAERTIKKAGIDTTGNVKRCHGFRKFAITMMIKAKVDYNVREYLVGHKVSRGLDVNYDRTSEEDRLAEYAKAINLLIISPEHRLKKWVQQLESQVDRSVLLEEQVNQMREEIAKIHAVVNEMPKIAHKLNEAGHEMGEVGHNLTEAVDILQLVEDPQRMNQLLQQLILKMQRKPEQKRAESKELQG
jgi:integrase